MNQQFRNKKQAIRDFMQNHYTDARLAELLAHAQNGYLDYTACCCFIGITTADHALVREGGMESRGTTMHYFAARELDGALAAEQAFNHIANYAKYKTTEARNAFRRRILVPMIRAEMKRRERARIREEYKQELCLITT